MQSYNSHLNNSTIHITSDERTKWNNKWDYNEETIKAVKVTSASSADSVAWSGIKDKPTTFTPSAHTHTFASLNEKPTTISGYGITDGLRRVTLANNVENDFNAFENLTLTGRGDPTTGSSLLNSPWTTQPAGGFGVLTYLWSSYGLQLAAGYDSNDLYVRNKHFNAGIGTVWNTSWDKILNSSNYNSYSPKLDGTGASGTWGIDISGNASSATKLATARKIWGRLFDGLADVSGDLEDVGNITASGKATIQGDIVCGGEVVAVAGEGTPAGVTDYSALTGKPQINGVTLVSGNNTLASLGIQAAGDYATNSGVTALLADYATKTFVSNNYVGKAAFNSHTADNDIHITSTERAAWNAKWNYDEATIKAVKVTSASSADSVAWAGIKDKPTTFTPSAHTHTASDVSGLPTSLKNPYALTFGSKTYDGSAAATITASDLGALTAHQSIYALTLQVNGTSKGVYNPASAAKTINIAVPTKTSDITNDSGFITSAAIPTALKNPYAVEIKANGVSLGTYDGSATATFNLSAANVGAASKVHSHNASEISGLPTNLSAFTNDVGYITGITKSMVEGVLTGDITSHTHSYLPLSGGTLSGSDRTLLRLKSSNSLGPIIDFHNPSGDVVVSFGHIPSNTNYGTFLSNVEGQIGLLLSNDGVAYLTTNTNYLTKNYTILHTGNYNSYAPTLTGTGASGTWGIDISGNAATATNANNANYIGEVDIDRIIYGDNSSKTKHTSYDDTDYFPSGFYVNNREFVIHQAYNYGNKAGITIKCVDRTNSPLYVKTQDGGGGGTYYQLARTIDNVASATKLQTPRTIWGRPFDGNADVSGNISGTYFHIEDRASNPYFKLVDSNGQIAYIQLLPNNEGVSIGSASTLPLTVNPSGNVLIGTTTDNGYKLQVNGSERIYGDLIVDGEVSALVA